MVAVAGVLGATAVAAAAMGAHLGAVAGNAEAQRFWQSANLIHLVHTPVLLALGLWSKPESGRIWQFSAVLFAMGVVLFSGSLYALAALESITSAPLAPLGGMALILAWLTLTFLACRNR